MGGAGYVHCMSGHCFAKSEAKPPCAERCQSRAVSCSSAEHGMEVTPSRERRTETAPPLPLNGHSGYDSELPVAFDWGMREVRIAGTKSGVGPGNLG